MVNFYHLKLECLIVLNSNHCAFRSNACDDLKYRLVFKLYTDSANTPPGGSFIGRPAEEAQAYRRGLKETVIGAWLSHIILCVYVTHTRCGAKLNVSRVQRLNLMTSAYCQPSSSW